MKLAFFTMYLAGSVTPRGKGMCVSLHASFSAASAPSSHWLLFFRGCPSSVAARAPDCPLGSEGGLLNFWSHQNTVSHIPVPWAPSYAGS